MAQLVVPKKLNPLDDVAQYLGIKQATQGLKAQQQQMDTAAMNAQQQQALQAIFKDPASYDPTTKEPTNDALMKANMIHPGIAAEMSKALGRDPVSMEQVKNLKSEQTLRTAQGANLTADNERATKTAADALKEKYAQEAAGVEIPSSGADVINPLTGKHTHSYQVRIRDPKDGSYTVETRYTDPLYEKPAAADLSVTPFEAWKKENPTAPVSEWLKLEAANKPVAAAGLGATESDPKDIAQAIIDGKQPPLLTGLYKNAAPVRAELARKGYDLATATTDWNATQKYLATLNGQQQTRLRQAISFTAETLPQVEAAYAEWKKQAGISGLKVLNKANLAAMKQLPGAAGSAAHNLDALISDFTSELGTVYKGGNSSTDESLKLAAQNLQGDWNDKTFSDAIKRLNQSITIRKNSMNATPAGNVGQEYAPQAPAAAVRRYNPATGKIE